MLKQQGGFSLIEVLVASLIVGIAMVGAALQMGSLMGEVGTTRSYTQALTAATEKLEELRAFNAESICTALESGSDADPIDGGNALLEREWTVEACASGMDCKDVTVSVSWEDREAAEQTVNLTTSVGCYDPVQSGVALLALNTAAGTTTLSYVEPGSESTGTESAGSTDTETDSGTESEESASGSDTEESAGGSDEESSGDSGSSSSTATAPAAPSVAWSDDKSQLLWSTVTDATGYKVYVCSHTTGDSLSACTPSTSSDQTTTGFSVPSPANNNTVCRNVTAVNSVGESVASSTFCVFYKPGRNGGFSYSP